MKERRCTKCSRLICKRLDPLDLIICKECGTVLIERHDGGLDAAPLEYRELPTVSLMIMFLPHIRPFV